MPKYLTEKHKELSEKAMEYMKRMKDVKVTTEEMLEQLKRTTPE